MEDTLAKLYYNVDSPVAYSSVLKLYKAARTKDPAIKLRDVKKWLESQYTYTIHRPIARKYTRSRYFVTGVDKLWQVDLADMSMINKDNDNYNYILTCIDVFSKYAWAQPVKRKAGKEVSEAFSAILSSGRRPQKLQSDKGKEFLNHVFQNLLKEQSIQFFTCNNPDIKCSIVERFNRTLKTRLWKYFTKTRSYRYIDVLDKFVLGYNTTRHRSIQMTPVEASKIANKERVYHNLYHNVKFRGTAKLSVGDLVRISKAKGLFEKGYLPNWSEELFEISKTVNSNPPKYFLNDLLQERIEGSFYEQELQKVSKPDSYWVEKIIKRRKRQGTTEYLVKWLGYPSKFNSWITEKDGFLPLSTQ